MQHLFVPVDIPYMEVIHTVSLHLHRDTMEALAVIQPVAVGQAIPAELKIQHTREWADPGSSIDDVLEFCLEVHASPDTWLIGGQRKAHFSAKVRNLPFPSLHFRLQTIRSMKSSAFRCSYYPKGRVTCFTHRLKSRYPVGRRVAIKWERTATLNDHPILPRWIIETKVTLFLSFRISITRRLASTSKIRSPVLGFLNHN